MAEEGEEITLREYLRVLTKTSNAAVDLLQAIEQQLEDFIVVTKLAEAFRVKDEAELILTAIEHEAQVTELRQSLNRLDAVIAIVYHRPEGLLHVSLDKDAEFRQGKRLADGQASRFGKTRQVR